MALFAPENRQKSDRHSKVYTAYEIAHTLVDFGAAVCFIIGSVAFLFEDWQSFATWNFLIGSVLFAVKPTLRLMRELQFLRLEQVPDDG